MWIRRFVRLERHFKPGAAHLYHVEPAFYSNTISFWWSIGKGLPASEIYISHGAYGVGNGLLEHKEVKAISFVRSQPVAEYIYKTASANGKRVQALAGAKNHTIVMPDADLHIPVKEIVNAAFG